MPHIAILGAGNMATALALPLAKHAPVKLYCIEPDVEEEINTRHQNEKYLKGIPLPENITASSNLISIMKDASTIFIAVPSKAVSSVMQQALPHLSPTATIVSISKGLDPTTLHPLIVEEAKLLPTTLQKRLTTLGGPAIANEMAKESPTALIAASEDIEGAKHVKSLLENHFIKVALSDDLLGVGLAAALKNPYAIALGMCDGLKHPTNAKAFLLTIALEEMHIMIKAAGGKDETAYGLAGLGDLTVTGFSPHGRNRTYGERLVGASSKHPEDLGLGTVEGIHATELAQKLARQLNVKTPLLDSIASCLASRTCFSQPFEQFLQSASL